MAPPPSQHVYLLRTKHTITPTWFAVHPTSMLTGLSRTMLVVFTKASHAERWARGLARYHHHHGTYPARHYTVIPRQFVWACDDTAEDEDVGENTKHTLDVVKMQLGDVLGYLKGSGAHVRVVVDPANPASDIDIRQGFDKPAVCARLQANLKASDLRRPHTDA